MDDGIAAAMMLLEEQLAKFWHWLRVCAAMPIALR